MTERLGARIAAGGLILVLMRLAQRLIGLVSVVILFRILAPADFGVVALAMVVVGFIEVFAEFGFEQALLRNAQAVRQDYDVTFTLNFIRGVAVSLLIAASAPLAAGLMAEPRLVVVLLVLSLVPLLDGLQNIGTIDFSKNLEFDKEFKLKVAQKLISFVVTLAGAFILRNYWALIIGVLSGRIAGVALSFAMHPYRPQWCLTGWRSVMRFSIWILANNIVLYAGNQTDKVVIQRAFSAHMVGIVRIAEEISGMVMELVWPIEKALFAGYVKVAHDIKVFHQTLTQSLGLVAGIGVPVSLGLGALAEPAVLLVLGEKGREAVPFVQIYVLHGALRSCLCGIYPAFTVLGRSDVNAQSTFMAVALRLTVLFTLFPVIGLMAVPWSMVAGTAVSFAVMWWRMTTLLKFPVLALPTAIWRVVLAAAAMYGAGHLGLSALPTALHVGSKVAIMVPACAAVYLGGIALLWWMCGRPDGAERSALHFFQQRWQQRGRRAP